MKWTKWDIRRSCQLNKLIWITSRELHQEFNLFSYCDLSRSTQRREEAENKRGHTRSTYFHTIKLSFESITSFGTTTNFYSKQVVFDVRLDTSRWLGSISNASTRECRAVRLLTSESIRARLDQNSERENWRMNWHYVYRIQYRVGIKGEISWG